MQDADPDVHRSMLWVLENDVEEMGDDLFFTADYEHLGEMKSHELKPGGANIRVRLLRREKKFKKKKILNPKKKIGWMF